ncbi:band 4.1-like protein 4 isoform X2 [Euwallacea similis]
MVINLSHLPLNKMDCFCSDKTPVHCKIVFLDETELVHELARNSTGQVLLDIVFKHLNLLETAYFGLRFLDQHGQTHWLDPAKKLGKQIKGADPYTLYFGVKFYAADPCKLLEEITRYQFFLQIKQDILQGRLLVPFDLAAELGAYILQSELGDYDPRRHGYGYVSEFRFLPNQSVELEMRIAELHQSQTGQMPCQAELNYLDKVKWLEMYGVDLHPVLGEDHVEYFLGLNPSGIIVLRNKTTVGNYYWPRITKIYFKGRYFMLRVAGKNDDECTYGFETPSKCACKHLWKCCVEHHAFFRLVQVTPTSPDIFALGSRFRYSGRTEKQAVRDAQLKLRQPPTFSRNASKRYQRRLIPGTNESQSQPTEPNHQPPQYQNQEVKYISLPLPADNFDSSCHTNTLKSNASSKKFDSPRSTRSAPWSQPHSKGLYNNSVPASPRSVRSGSRHRSSSLDSQSSNESRSCRRRRHRSRTSDNESELSKSSNKSRRKHRKRRSKSRRDSESEQDTRTRERRRSKSKPDKFYELVDSGLQWQEAQIKNTRDSNSNTIQQATVVSSSKNNEKAHRPNSSDYGTHNRQNKHRKHRSRSRSPGEHKSWIPDELKKHLEYDLVDTSGMSDVQLKEIPYTVVKTNFSKHVKLKNQSTLKMEGSHGGSPLTKTRQYSTGPLYNTKAIMDEALTNFSYPDSIEGSHYYHGVHMNQSACSSNFNSSILDSFPNFHKVQHEHSDSGLGVER